MTSGCFRPNSGATGARSGARADSVEMPGQTVVTWDDETPKTVDIVCGYCRVTVEAKRISQAVELERTNRFLGYGSIGVVVGATYQCPRSDCRGPSVVFWSFHDQLGQTYGHDVIGQLPRGYAEPMEGLPEEVASDRDEAWSCLYGGDLRASVIMGRASIQRAVRTLEATGTGLKAEVADLATKGVITQSLREWADEVRIAGDDAAHPEDLGKVTREEAEESLTFMDAFLEHAIALPAKREALKAARQEAATS